MNSSQNAMKKLSFIPLIFANSLFAGTAGNSDLKLVLVFLLLLCLLIFAVERTVRYIRNKRLESQAEKQSFEEQKDA